MWWRSLQDFARENWVMALPPWPWDAAETLRHFPNGYTPRPQQATAITRIVEAFQRGKRFVVLEKPTGGGKSFDGMCLARTAKANGENTHFLTTQRTLQDQYEKDFPAPEVELLKGRSNYTCTHAKAREGATAAEGACRDLNKGILTDCIDMEMAEGLLDPSIEGSERRKVIMMRAVGLDLTEGCHYCPYWKQLQKCADNPVTLFNFDSFLHQTRLGRFGQRKLMLIDEAHNVESKLMSFVSMELTEWKLDIIDVKIDREVTTKGDFQKWLSDWNVIERVEKRLDNMSEASEDTADDLRKVEMEVLFELQTKLKYFMTYLDKTEWILETEEYQDKRCKEQVRKIVARPLYATAFADDLLFRHGERVLAMSATILDVSTWAESLGIPMNEIEHVEAPCDFPPENRPIHLEYCGSFPMSYGTRLLPHGFYSRQTSAATRS